MRPIQPVSNPALHRSRVRRRFLSIAAHIALFAAVATPATPIGVGVACAQAAEGHAVAREATTDDPAAPVAPPGEALPSEEGPPGKAIPQQREEYTGPERDQVFFEAYWDHGIKYRLLGAIRIAQEGHWTAPYLTRDPVVIGELGVNLQVDAAAYVEAQGIASVPDKVDVRRSFITLRGTFFNFLYPIDFSIEMGAITQKFFVNESFLQLNELPYVGSLKLGQYTAPVSLDALTSSRDTTFLERASPVQAFSPGTQAGIELADHSRAKRLTWAVGLFADGQNGEVGDASESFARVVGRLSWVPLIDDTPGKPALLHLGIAGSYLFSSNNTVRYQSRPESFLAPIAIDTGVIDASNGFIVATEAAFVSGSLSGQFEYLHAFANGGSAGSVDFPGLYLQVNGFLTGEHRPYNYTKGVFGQVIPHHPISYSNKTWGALEWAARYSYTDLDSGPVRGGKMHMLTAGWNWYWNRYIRWQLDYGLSLIDNGALDGNLHIFQLRMQIVA